MYVSACRFVHINAGLWEDQRHQILLDVELNAVMSYPLWVLRTELTCFIGSGSIFSTAAAVPNESSHGASFSKVPEPSLPLGNTFIIHDYPFGCSLGTLVLPHIARSHLLWHVSKTSCIWVTLTHCHIRLLA